MHSLAINQNSKKAVFFAINLIMLILLFNVVFQVSNIRYVSDTNNLSGCEYKLAVSHWPF
jgi:hypothetical protein